MADYFSDERHDYNHDGTERGFQSTIHNVLHGITRGQGRSISSSLWENFLQAAIVFATTWIAANPIFGQIGFGIFATWYAWDNIWLYLDSAVEWVKNTVAASVTLPYEDDDIVDSIQTYAFAHGLGCAKHTITMSTKFAQNSYFKNAPDGDDIFVVPSFTTHVFLHNRRLFIITREQDGKTKLWSVGRSAKPINDMLRDVHKAWIEKKSERQITVFCAETTRRGDNPEMSWVQQPKSDRRTMESVSLPSETKTMLYANRGKPYQQGYLLFGPPGCGKTSFAKAVATDYKLDVYALSLSSEYLNDETLSKLFNSVPARSIILLDDIDVTGLSGDAIVSEGDVRVGLESERSEELLAIGTDHDLDSTKASVSAESWSSGLSDSRQKTHPKAGLKGKVAQKKERKLTRAALLTAIDGISGSTGRILIVTTNFPQKLDPALRRAGRLDFEIEFSYANREQIREIFMLTMKPFTEEELQKYNDDAMQILADKFAISVPENELSPAQLQQYCTEQIDDPEAAANGFSAWLEKDKAGAARIANYAAISKKWTVGHQQYEDDDVEQKTALW